MSLSFLHLMTTTRSRLAASWDTFDESCLHDHERSLLRGRKNHIVDSILMRRNQLMDESYETQVKSVRIKPTRMMQVPKSRCWQTRGFRADTREPFRCYHGAIKADFHHLRLRPKGFASCTCINRGKCDHVIARLSPKRASSSPRG